MLTSEDLPSEDTCRTLVPSLERFSNDIWYKGRCYALGEDSSGCTYFFVNSVDGEALLFPAITPFEEILGMADKKGGASRLQDKPVVTEVRGFATMTLD